MNAPLIGITAHHAAAGADKSPVLAPLQAYAAAVAGAGGLPVIIPPIFEERQLRRLFRRLDGIVFSGGGDVDPRRYDATPMPQVRDIDRARDETEILLARWAVEAGKPFLGICRGLQVINVALGGSLRQHLEASSDDAPRHDDEPAEPGKVSHAVRLAGGSLVARVTGKDALEANSYHHQAVETLAGPFSASGWSVDGIIEAFELPGHAFGLAVQWHPERLLDRPEARAIFAALADAAAPS